MFHFGQAGLEMGQKWTPGYATGLPRGRGRGPRGATKQGEVNCDGRGCRGNCSWSLAFRLEPVGHSFNLVTHTLLCVCKVSGGVHETHVLKAHSKVPGT